MKKILMDTNAYVAFKKNEPRAVSVFKTAEFIGVNVVVMGELLSGFKGGSRESSNRKELNAFLDSPRVNVIDIDEETAEYFALIYWALKKKGRPIPANDLWIAASAMRHGLALVSYDDHFNDINGLILYRDV